MIDGFTIEKGIVAPENYKNEPKENRSFKKLYITIALSLFVHVILFCLLFLISDKQAIKTVAIEPKAIKSYVYKMPSKAKAPTIVAEIKPEEIKLVEPQKINIEEKPVAVKQVPDQQVISKKELPKKSLVNTPQPTEQSKAVNEVTAIAKQESSKPKTAVKATFSAYKQLNNLRSSINEKIIAEEFSQLQQFRSPSVMHGEQIPVPHSELQLTPEQEKEQRTTRSSDSISITKYDNGLCTIERKQFLGSPIEGSSSGFACGESKFDKNFREHMKKVQEKIMPKR